MDEFQVKITSRLTCPSRSPVMFCQLDVLDHFDVDSLLGEGQLLQALEARPIDVILPPSPALTWSWPPCFRQQRSWNTNLQETPARTNRRKSSRAENVINMSGKKRNGRCQARVTGTPNCLVTLEPSSQF